jgi:phospholipase D1/2
LIAKAEKFIYIENQFFISATHPNGAVKNKIMEAICNRIQKAIKL